MDEKLERVIDLAAQLQEAMKECDCVIGYNVAHIGGTMDGSLHILYPDKAGFTELEPDYIDRRGEQWVKTSYKGVEIHGRLSREAATNTVAVHFPNGDTVCRWCPYVRYDESLRRHRCLFTNEYLPFPMDTRGNECPIAFENEEEET